MHSTLMSSAQNSTSKCIHLILNSLIFFNKYFKLSHCQVRVQQLVICDPEDVLEHGTGGCNKYKKRCKTEQVF